MTISKNNTSDGNPKGSRIDMLSVEKRENRMFFLAFVLSFVCHIVFFSVLIYGQSLPSRRRPLPTVMNVSLVSLQNYAAPMRQTSKPATAKVNKAPEKKTAVSREKSSTAPAVSKKSKKKVSLKKKTFKSEKVKKSALKKLEKKVESTTSDRITKAIEKIREKVDDEKDKRPPDGETALPSDSKGIFDVSGAAGGKTAELIDIYRVEIAYQIQKNWAFPDQLATSRSDLQALLVFKVLPNGEIKDLFFTDRSGNSHLDESAYRAVMKTNPVMPHPKAISLPYVQMGLRFTKEGIK